MRGRGREAVFYKQMEEKEGREEGKRRDNE
jgi:hypothetical protein